MVMRLPQVHDTRRQGLVTYLVQVAREKGRMAYVGEGRNRWPAVHVSDAVRLYRLALERGRAGALQRRRRGGRGAARHRRGGRWRFEDAGGIDHAGRGAGVLRLDGAAAGIDLAASGALTRQQLGWDPTGPDLLSDLRAMDYGAA